MPATSIRRLFTKHRKPALTKAVGSEAGKPRHAQYLRNVAGYDRHALYTAEGDRGLSDFRRRLQIGAAVARVLAESLYAIQYLSAVLRFIAHGFH